MTDGATSVFLFWGSLKPRFLFRKRKRKGGVRNRSPEARAAAARNIAHGETQRQRKQTLYVSTTIAPTGYSGTGGKRDRLFLSLEV